MLFAASGNPVNGGVGEEIIAEDIENDPIEYYIPAGGLGSTTFTVNTVNISGQYRALLYFQSDVVLDREVCVCTVDKKIKCVCLISVQYKCKI